MEQEEYHRAVGFVGAGKPRYRLTMRLTDLSLNVTEESYYDTWDREDLKDAVQAAASEMGVYI